jgi:hypothetical protein
MARIRNYSRSGFGLLILLVYVIISFIILFVILLIKLLAYPIISFVIPFVINIINKRLADQQRLVCTKCLGKLEVIDKEGNLYCKNCKIIKMDRH